MLDLTAIFLIVAVVAALVGSVGLAVAALGVAKIGFWIFMGLFFVSMLVRLVRGT